MNYRKDRYGNEKEASVNIHKKMKRIKLIGCILLLGIITCACRKEKELPDEAISINGQVEQSSENGGSEDAAASQPGAREDATAKQEENLTWETYPWQLKPGEVTMENLLVTAFHPMGETMYIWGGGWNEEDTGAGPDATTLGLSPLWAEFAKDQTLDYDYHNYKYEIHKGLDCSGYIGWVIYNLFETENGQEGYVMKSSKMAENFADRGWGTYTRAEEVTEWLPGDIMSMDGHVWMSLGSMEDGSVVILHSSITGVFVAGTSLEDGEDSQAVKLAEKFMAMYYPDWYERFPDCSRPYRYLTESDRFRWDDKVLEDKWNLKGLEPDKLLDSMGQKFLAK